MHDYLINMAIRVTGALVFIFTLSRVDSRSIESDDDSKYGPIVGINLLHRHGARTIDKYMAKDPYGKDEYWPEGIGELTKDGILQHYEQGEWIAEVYGHLLPHDWMDIKDGIKVFSTDWNRTIMSAQAELAGMFPIEEDKLAKWEGLQSYLVPVHTIPESQDALLEVTKNCPLLKTLLQENIKSKPYQKLMKEHKKVAEQIEKTLGEKIYDLDNYQQVNSILSIEVSERQRKDRRNKLTSSTKKFYPKPLADLARISFAAPTWTKQLKRMRGGPMINEFIRNIENKIDNPKFRGVTIYSAHDTTISAFLNSLNNLFTEEELSPPPFAALVIIEHRQKGHKNFVRILYRCPYTEDVSTECNIIPRVLTVPGCEAFCPLDKFKEILSDFRPTDWERECHGKPGDDEDSDEDPSDEDPSDQDLSTTKKPGKGKHSYLTATTIVQDYDSSEEDGK